eukprot:TRINITY_DN10698_c0_g1_i1.p4 TRINITY_DN10698_c0_g1~~TRINITY_DN10698_c0_g1_i1.p4  ORF type:complete len:104 (-),score=6.07 TRINITY_DN10698_c0_g1_i1:283-594(-)
MCIRDRFTIDYCFALNITEVISSIKNPQITPITKVEVKSMVWGNSGLSGPSIAPKAAGKLNINPIIIPCNDQCLQVNRLTPMATPIRVLPRIMFIAKKVGIAF